MLLHLSFLITLAIKFSWWAVVWVGLLFISKCRKGVLLGLLALILPHSQPRKIFWIEGATDAWYEGSQVKLNNYTGPQGLWVEADGRVDYTEFSAICYELRDTKRLGWVRSSIADFRYIYLNRLAAIGHRNTKLAASMFQGGRIDAIWYAYGLGHLLSIQTYHVRSILYQSRLKFAMRYFSGMLVAVLYMMISPNDLSLWRIWTMMLLRAIHVWVGYQCSMMELYLLSTMLWVSYDPQWMGSLGFWLSSIISAAYMRHQGLSRMKFQFLIGSQVMAVLYLFEHRMHLVSIVSPYFLTPLFMEVIYPVLTVGLGLLLFDADWGGILIRAILTLVSKLEWILVHHHQMLDWQMMPGHWLQAMLFILSSFLDWRWSLLSVFWLLPVSSNIKDGQLSLDMLDVGHGLSIVLQTKNHNLIYDAGSMQSKRIESALSQVLHQRKMRSIDAVIYSHADYDHTSAHQFLQRFYQVKQVYSGEPLMLQNQQLCQKGMQWQWDGVVFSFLHPDQSEFYQGNQSSCVLHIKTKHHQILLTGDIDHQIESKVLMAYPNIAADVLLASHHGSKTASSVAWLDHFKPSTILLSARRKAKVSATLDTYADKIVRAPYHDVFD